ncbi:MAG: hypothetical protein QF466_09360 [Desulfobacterales bacterium]|jgi:hypothetical protein|nr:hypothetical protein [Desulfobacterales bacterium]MDP6681805.1 hypothetical protein [Desulfobacterales bacterium]MDP6807984.1 hypothetical protein [Desulfobacterales bacterium]
MAKPKEHIKSKRGSYGKTYSEHKNTQNLRKTYRPNAKEIAQVIVDSVNFNYKCGNL